MSRPETHADLTPQETSNHPFVTLHDISRILEHPSVGALLLEIKARAKADGLIEETQYGSLIFSSPRSEKELDEALASAQRQYDSAKSLYDGAMRGDDLAYAYQYDSYTSREGLGSGYAWHAAETARRAALPLDAPEDEDDTSGALIAAGGWSQPIDQTETETTEESKP